MAIDPRKVRHELEVRTMMRAIDTGQADPTDISTEDFLWWCENVASKQELEAFIDGRLVPRYSPPSPKDVARICAEDLGLVPTIHWLRKFKVLQILIFIVVGILVSPAAWPFFMTIVPLYFVHKALYR